MITGEEIMNSTEKLFQITSTTKHNDLAFQLQLVPEPVDLIALEKSNTHLQFSSIAMIEERFDRMFENAKMVIKVRLKIHPFNGKQ